jgi:hypothetical protein
LLKASPQHKETNDIVKGIVRLVIETNGLSTVVAILSLILFYGTPNTTYFLAPTMVLAKLYANTLLVIFNNRAFIHNTGGTISHSPSVNDSYSRGGRSKSMPFSAGLGLSSETEAYTGTGTFPGKVTVTTHSVADDMDGYRMNRMQVCVFSSALWTTQPDLLAPFQSDKASPL